MSPRPAPRPLALFLFLAAAAVAGCRTAEPEAPAAAPRPAFRPWTRAFREPAVLVAREIRIEGPSDLLEHFASLQDPATVDHEVKTVPGEGLLVTSEIKPGFGGLDIRGQLDGLEIHALRRLAVMQRLERDVPVTVRATGAAWWSRADGSDERRDETIVLRGEHGG